MSGTSILRRLARSHLGGYAIALLISLVVALLTFLLAPLLQQGSFLLLLLAVVLSTWYGGRGPGLLATVLGTLSSASLSLSFQNLSDLPVAEVLLWFSLSVLLMLLVSLLTTVGKRGQTALLHRAALVESSDDAIISQGLDGTIKSWNSGAQRMYGYSAEEVAGQSASILFAPGHDAEYLERLGRGDAGYRFESVHSRRDGQPIDVAVTISPIKDGNGQVTGTSMVARDITESKRLRDQEHATLERLMILSQRLMEAQETERRYIARELHDEIGQELTAVKLNLHQAQLLLASPGASPIRESIDFLPTLVSHAEGGGEIRNSTLAGEASLTRATLDESVSLIEGILQQVRNLSLDLHPSVLDDLGLVPALRWHLDRVSQRAGLAADFRADEFEERLAVEIELACFRVAQEALTNVIRHAQAKHAHVELARRDQEVELTIQDDGIGFDVSAARSQAARGRSLGLLGMEERIQAAGGKIEITSQPAKGTRVSARFPLAGGEAPRL